MSQQLGRDDVHDLSSDEGSKTKQKVAATCTACDAVYAAEQWPDGKVLPIGRKRGCRCGSTEYEILE